MFLIPDFKTVISFINDTAEPDCMPSRSSESYTIYNIHKIVIITVLHYIQHYLSCMPEFYNTLLRLNST
jgi:hypothetical protein